MESMYKLHYAFCVFLDIMYLQIFVNVTSGYLKGRDFLFLISKVASILISQKFSH